MPRAQPSASGTSTATVAASKSRRRPATQTNAHPSSSRTLTGTTSSGNPSISSNSNGGVTWQVERQHLPSGDTREVIVLDDSPTPPPSGSTRKRTRERAEKEKAAAAAAAAQVAPSPSSKKRRIEDPAGGAAPQRAKIASDLRRPAAGQASSSRAVAHPPPPPPVPAPATAACDDDEGHYIITPGDLVYGKYRIVRKLGEGTFGKVVECVDKNTKRKYAVKIIRAVQKYRDASKIEIRVLNALKAGDPHNEHKCIHLAECFDHRNHVCLVFELLGSSVFDFLKENDFIPFPMANIQDFARQLLASVAYMHSLHLVHTDLKPENILLADSSNRLAPRYPDGPKRLLLNNTDIRLIDFGSATFEREYHSTVVSTRHYRAPEIILGLGWSYPCDMFSIGCILVEFFTGEALFQTHGNLEHLHMMELVMGKMPDDLRQRATVAKPEFFKGHKLDYPNSTTDRSARKFLKTMRTLDQILPPTSVVNTRFCDLIRRLLAWDPNHRLTVEEALRHPFFALQINLE